MKEIIVSAKTYDEALTKALIELQTISDNVDVEVLEEGTDGLFGILGGKPWEIKVITKTTVNAAEEKKKESAAEKVQKTEELKEEIKEKIKEETKEEIKEPEAVVVDTVTVVETEEGTAVYEEVTTIEKKELPVIEEEDVKDITEKAETFLKDVFKVMKMDVDIKSSFDHNENELYTVLSGDDMGVLIGKRGQTLDSLQYLTSLVVNKHRENYIRVKLDTENYRERREEKLQELARNIAEKVKRTRHSVELEPMNPYERRIIHSALQGDDLVTTISEGEEPYRYVVVLLKKDPKKGNRRRYH